MLKGLNCTGWIKYSDGKFDIKEGAKVWEWLDEEAEQPKEDNRETLYKLEKIADDYAERVCNGQFPITYSREQVVKHTAGDFIAGASEFQRHVLSVLKENYEACKNLVDEDKIRTAQDIVNETYEDLIEIFSTYEWLKPVQSPKEDVQEQGISDEKIEPILMKAGDKRVLVNGAPLPVDFRIVAEEKYQGYKAAIKSQPDKIRCETVSKEEYEHAINQIGQLQEQLNEAEQYIRDLQK